MGLRGSLSPLPAPSPFRQPPISHETQPLTPSSHRPAVAACREGNQAMSRTILFPRHISFCTSASVCVLSICLSHGTTERPRAPLCYCSFRLAHLYYDYELLLLLLLYSSEPTTHTRSCYIYIFIFFRVPFLYHILSVIIVFFM